MDIYNNWSYLLGLILIMLFLLYSYVLLSKKSKVQDISSFAAIAIILFSIPRLLHVLFVISFSQLTRELVESYKVEITLGLLLLVIISIKELLKLLNANRSRKRKS